MPERAAIITCKEVANLLGVSRRQLYRWIPLGCPAHKVGGRTVFFADEVISWVRSQPAPALKASAPLKTRRK